MTEAKKRRLVLRPRFTLAALLVLITLIAIPLSYVAQRRAWNLRRKAALQDLTAKGVGLSPEIPSEFGLLPPPPGPAPTAPTGPAGFQKWWRDLLLDDATPQIKMMVYSLPRRKKQEFAPLTDADCQLLAFFPEAEFVEIFEADLVTDQGLNALTSVQNLRQLKLNNLPLVEANFLRHWPKKSPIQAVHLDRIGKLQGQNLKGLKNAQSLELLWLARCPTLTDESLHDVELSPRVDHLMVRQCPVGDETIERWLTNRQLKNLHLAAKITRKSAAAISAQHDLDQLYLLNAPLVDEDFEFLKHCNHLNTLRLESMPVRGDLLKWIPHPEKIHFLELNSTLFDDAHFAKLARFTSLSTLNLHFTPISGEGIEGASPFPCNCRLGLMGTQFSDQGKSALAAISFRAGINSQFSTVSLPSNWTVDDFKRFSGGKAPWKFEVDIPAASAIQQTTSENVRHYQSGWRSRWATEPLDNCPADLMAPVIRLRKLAEERSDDEERRLIEEFLGIKPTPATPSAKKSEP